MKTVDRTRIRVLGALALAGLGMRVDASLLPPPTLAGRLDLLLEQQQESAPGLSILVIEDGAVRYQRSKGMADLTRKTAITHDTVFALGAVSGVVNVIALVQLIESGKLAPDDSIGKYLADVVPALGAIRVRQLLTHEASRQIPATARESMVARLIARASGMPYAACVRSSIFAPAGMTSSYVSGTPAPRPQDEALGLGLRADDAPFDIHSCVADLGRLMRAFSATSLIKTRFDLLYASDYQGFHHLVRGNAERDLYTVVLSNGGAATGALLAKTLAAVAAIYEQPMPQM